MLANRYISPDSIIFLDEVETSLHPKAVVQFLRIIYELSKTGLQFFIASHSYFVIKALYLMAKRDPYDNLLHGIPENSIIDESVRLYEEEIALTMGHDYEND